MLAVGPLESAVQVNMVLFCFRILLLVVVGCTSGIILGANPKDQLI